MLLNLFLNNVWLAIGLWAGLYLLDYIFTLKAARLYKEGANKHFAFPDGIELNPYFKEDIGNLRRFQFPVLPAVVLCRRFTADCLQRRIPGGVCFPLGHVVLDADRRPHAASAI